MLKKYKYFLKEGLIKKLMGNTCGYSVYECSEELCLVSKHELIGRGIRDETYQIVGLRWKDGNDVYMCAA